MHNLLQRKRAVFSIEEGKLRMLKNKMLNWANRFGIFLFLDSNNHTIQDGKYDCLMGAGGHEIFIPVANEFDELSAFHKECKDWMFGHLCYDLKNQVEPKLSSAHDIKHGFPLIQFFVPEVVMGILYDGKELFIEAADPENSYQQLIDTPEHEIILPELHFSQRIGKEEYLGKIEALREHIRNGDCYEVNFCNESFCENADIDPIATFKKLNELSPAPFAAHYKLDDKHLMCASPERYLRKTGDKVISQPIKGTARRDDNRTIDEQLKKDLYNSEKERAENVMIVDLVRNDLARSCEVGSINVDELFGIYSFPQVHQMISTVSGVLKKDRPFTDALKNSFPMGSMTGAPKMKVMELIEKYELARRELFAGSVGYISPEGDFDFNVVIRSLFYNAASKYLSYQTGGAITWDSNAESEWDEMRLKAGAMEKVFSGK